MTRPKGSRRADSGMSMIEVLVAVTILAIAVVIALVLYDAARKSFKKGENVTEQQQAVRIAFDRLNADLRMAGYNYNPDGNIGRPDEQIEAAFDTAIVLRADLDAGTADATTPETALATSGAFTTVSTGNDEVIAYVLGKPDGSSPGTLSFQADFHSPRTGEVQNLTIPHVALVQDDPPYTLYRVTFSNTDGSAVKTPLVDNVRSMTFRYLTLEGNQINVAFDLSSTAEDIGGGDATETKEKRGTIRRISVDLIGLTRDPDLTWVDSEDTDPDTRSYRKFQLVGDVTPRNLGMKGMSDLLADLIPPSKPGTPTLHPGHCGGFYVTWPANPSDDGVASYRVSYGTVPGAPTAQRDVAATEVYIGSLSDATTYYVTVQALDAAGNASVPSDEVSGTTSNTTTPKAPTSLAATSDMKSSVRLTWSPVTENTTNVSGDPASPTIRDLGGYDVYRGTTSSFTPGVGNRIAEKVGVATPLYLDIAAVNCRQYYYRVTAVDDPCGVEGAPSDVAAGIATSAVPPEPPRNVQAFLIAGHGVRVTWQASQVDTEGSQVVIDTYKVWRSRDAVPLTGDPLGVEYVQIGTATGALSFDYSTPPTALPDTSYYYRVSAVDDCPNESELSNAAAAQCAFSGTVSITSPTDGQAVAGVVTVTGGVVLGTDTYTKATFTYTHATAGLTRTLELASAGPTWTDDGWLADPPGLYTIVLSVENSAGCVRSATIQVTAGDVVGCCLSPPNPTQNPVVLACASGTGGCMTNTYQVVNNGCRTAVAIEGMTVTWVDVVGNGAKLISVKFDGSVIWSLSPYSPSPASTTFSDPKPLVTLDRTSSNPLVVTYSFNWPTAVKTKSICKQDTMTTTYGFRLLDETGAPTAITGQCGPAQGMFANLIVSCP